MAKADLLERVEPVAEEPAIDELTQIKLTLKSSSKIETTFPMDRLEGGEDRGLETITDHYQGAQVIHKRDRRVRLYKPNGTMFMAQAVNLDRLVDSLDGHCSLVCFTCHTDCGGSPWGCNKTENPGYFSCGVCGKKFYDRTLNIRVYVPDTEPDPYRKEDALLANSKVSAGQSNLYAHYWAYHPDQAAAAGIPRRF